MKNLKYLLILLCSRICFAQPTQSTIVPPCTLNFTFNATNLTSSNLANQQIGCDKWTLTVYNAGFGSFTVTLQSALAATTSTPGSFGTYTGTTATGSNPLTTTGIATFTNGTVATPWLRVVFTGTGAGTVYGVLQGSQTVISKGGGGGGSGTINPGTTGELAAYAGSTTIGPIVATDSNASFPTSGAYGVRLGPAESTLPSWIQSGSTGNAPAQVLTTLADPTGLKIGLAIESQGTGLQITNTETLSNVNSFGLNILTFGIAAGGTVNAIYETPTIGNGITGTAGLQNTGVWINSGVSLNSSVTNNHGVHFQTPFLAAGASETNVIPFYSEAIGPSGTNAFPFWFDDQGVYVVHSTNVFNSVYQARPALYNPLFTKFVPGANNFERIVQQWSSNVGQIGTEAGGTGTLRDLQLIGNRLLLKGCIIDTSSNISCPGSVTSGSGSGIAGILDLTQGTLPSIPANSWGWLAPTAMTTSQYYQHTNAVAAAHSVWIIGAPSANFSTIVGKVIPDCQDTGGNHLNFTQSSDAFSCGTSGGSGGGAASVSNFTAVTVNANSTAEQTLQELALTSGMLNSLGAASLIHGAGTLTIQALQTPTLTFKVKLCAVSGCGSGTVVTLGTTTTGATVAATANPWNINLKAVTNVIGASGTLITDGALIVDIGAVATLADTVYSYPPVTSSAINLTGLLFIDFTVTSSTQPGTPFNSFTQTVSTIEPASSQGPAGPAGAAGALTLISQQTLSGAAASVTFNSIPGTFTDLILSVTARGDAAVPTINPGMQFNGDSGNNYFYNLLGTNSTSGSGGPIAYLYIGNLPGASTTAGIAGSAQVTIPYYANTSFIKLASIQGTAVNGTLTGATIQMMTLSGYWNNAAAITSITVITGTAGGNFVTGSIFSLYGRT